MAGGGAEKVEAKFPGEMQVEAMLRTHLDNQQTTKPTDKDMFDLVRYFVLRCDAEMEMEERESRHYVMQQLSWALDRSPGILLEWVERLKIMRYDGLLQLFISNLNKSWKHRLELLMSGTFIPYSEKEQLTRQISGYNPILRCYTGMEMEEADPWKAILQQLIIVILHHPRFLDPLMMTQRELVDLSVAKMNTIKPMTHVLSLLEHHVTRLETKDLPWLMEQRFNILIGGGDEEDVDMDRGTSATEAQNPSIDSRLTPLETEGRCCDGSGYRNDEEDVDMDRGTSAIEEQIPSIDFRLTPLETEGRGCDGSRYRNDEEDVDMDRGTSAMEEQMPSINSRLTPLESEAESVMVLGTKMQMEGESKKLVEQLQSEVLSCGPAAQFHDDDGADGSGDKDKEEVEMGRTKSLGMVMEVEYLELLQSEIKMVMEVESVKQLQSEIRLHLEYLEALLRNKETPEDPYFCVPMVISVIKASEYLTMRGYSTGFPFAGFLQYAPKLPEYVKKMEKRKQQQQIRGVHAAAHPDSMDNMGEPLSILEEQPKMEGESSSSMQQQSHPSSPAPGSPGSNKGKQLSNEAAHPEIMDNIGEPLLLLETFASADDDAAPPGSMDDIGKPLLLLEEQAKMEAESFSSQEQQPRIQDYELKSGPTVEDSFLGFLQDMPFAYAEDDDDNKEDIINSGKSDEQIAIEEEMACEEKEFASYRRSWESLWKPVYGFFPDMTAVSPMHFTSSTPGCEQNSAACFGQTLQIFTIKLAEIKGGIKWPLFVYGVIAARDDVDHNRNLLFSYSRMEAQKLDQDDPFLRLIGPSRAILFTDRVKFEAQLRVKGATLYEDRSLISAFCDYTAGHYPGVFTTCFENCLCTIELCLEQIERTVQATVLSVRVKNGPWPFKYGGEVACFAPSYKTAPSSMAVVLLASRGKPMPKCSDGYLHLSRNVVSVGLEASLTFSVHAYSQSGEIAAQCEVCFIPSECNIAQKTCFFRDSEVEVEITVAWSAIVSDKRSIAGDGWMFEVSTDQGWDA